MATKMNNCLTVQTIAVQSTDSANLSIVRNIYIRGNIFLLRSVLSIGPMRITIMGRGKPMHSAAYKHLFIT